MELLRIKLKQNKAHYRKEETIDNKMTYPLPPFSTIIGALHRACNFTEYHPMRVSVQGKYKTLTQQVYTDYTFLNSINDDRGILVKVENPKCLSAGFVRVAEALKPQGNSFVKEETIMVLNRALLDEYKYLKENDSKSKELEKYKTLVTALKRYEVLHEVEPVIHIAGDRELLETIEKNIYNLKALGRSEDFVDVEEYGIVNTQEIDEEKTLMSSYTIYANYEDVKNKIGYIKTDRKNIGGTLYYINKDYKIVKKKREFNKIKVIYGSKYEIIKENEHSYWDGKYVISLN